MITPDNKTTVCSYTTEAGFSYVPMEIPNVRTENITSVVLYSVASGKTFVAPVTVIKLDTGEIVEIVARGRVIYSA